MPIAEISVIPLGTESPSVSKYVASALSVLRKEKGIKYELTSMGTIIEAPSLKKLLSIAEKMHRKVFSLGVRRVVTTIKIDERKDKKMTLEGKVASVRGKLSKGRSINADKSSF
ncbi:MAG: MTH1187 family thiamine-binding protein [Candidatus Omnitrophica bacterium]|nr:MTH1187 family thiamine-binding protein [Candidatus Omnitrophota bacterium]